MNQQIYNVDVNWLEFRKGTISSDVLDQTIEVATPPEFTKGMSRIWSPEHLFVAAAASCYMTAFLAVVEKARLEFIGFHCKASGVLESVDGHLAMTKIVLRPLLVIASENEIGKAMKTLQTSHKCCALLHSMRSDITLMPRVEVWQHALRHNRP